MQKVGIAGVGALGGIVAKALIDGIDGYELTAISDIHDPDLGRPNVDFDTLAARCDIVVECLPAAVVGDIVKPAMAEGKTLICISAAAFLLDPSLMDHIVSPGRIIVPSGALSGLDAVSALREGGIDSTIIKTTKPPKGLAGAPFITVNDIDLDNLQEKRRIFHGNAFEAAKAFPANVNVAASLSLAGLGPERTMVEVWADPAAVGNCHEITVKGGTSTITSRVDNLPDPSNPKSSMLAAYSIISTLKKLHSLFTVM